MRGIAKKRDEALRIATRGADSEGSEESKTESLGVAMRSDAERCGDKKLKC